MDQLLFPPWSLWWLKHLSLLAPKEDVNPFPESTPVSATRSHSFWEAAYFQEKSEGSGGDKRQASVFTEHLLMECVPTLGRPL